MRKELGRSEKGLLIERDAQDNPTASKNPSRSSISNRDECHFVYLFGSDSQTIKPLIASCTCPWVAHCVHVKGCERNSLSLASHLVSGDHLICSVISTVLQEDVYSPYFLILFRKADSFIYSGEKKKRNLLSPFPKRDLCDEQ